MTNNFFAPKLSKFFTMSIIFIIALILSNICTWAIVVQKSCKELIPSVIRIPLYYIEGGWISNIIMNLNPASEQSISAYLTYTAATGIITILLLLIYWYILSCAIIWLINKAIHKNI